MRLIPGHLALSSIEDSLNDAWVTCLKSHPYSFQITTIFKTIIDRAAENFEAEVVLIDTGPNLGSINRAVSICSDYLILSVASDMFSILGLKTLGKTLNKWNEQWKKRNELKPPDLNTELPDKAGVPAGYIVMQNSGKGIHPAKSMLKWTYKIHEVYSDFVLNQTNQGEKIIEKDENCLSLLKFFSSLESMSMEVRKLIFSLRPADDATGTHMFAVQKSYAEFEELSNKFLLKCPLPTKTQ